MSSLPSCFSDPVCYVLPIAAVLITVIGSHYFTKSRELTKQREERRQDWKDSFVSLVEDYQDQAIGHFYSRKDGSEISHGAVLIVNGIKRIPEKIKEAEYASTDARDALLSDYRRFYDLVTGHTDFQNTNAVFPVDQGEFSARINEVVEDIKARARDHVNRGLVFP